MKNLILSVGRMVGWAMLCFHSSFTFFTQSQPILTTNPPQTEMTPIATGTFEVKLTPLPPIETLGDTSLGSMIIDKRFFGDLEAHSKGQMLTAMTTREGSAGYVAVESVSGTLNERFGTFVLQHSGTMVRGVQHLIISVVPDSGTDGLIGISGEMKIAISEGKHFYEFTYTLDSDS